MLSYARRSAARNVAKAPSKLPGEAKAASDLTLDPPFCVSLPVLINPLPPPRLPASGVFHSPQYCSAIWNSS